MSDKKFYVYAHTNKTNNKKYIGITCRDPKIRWQNGNGYKHHKKFYAAIIKYGWDNFIHEILFEGLSFEEANLKEQELIELYNSINNGYNMTKGGEGCLGFVHSKESKQKMSQSRKGRKLSEEWKEHLSQSLQGRVGSNKGGHLSESHKQKISKGVRQNYAVNNNIINNNKNVFPSKKVVCDNIEFDSIQECAKFYNVDNSQMGRWLNGRSFVPEEFVNKNLHYKDVDPNYVLCQLKTQQIYCDGTIYESLTQCSEQTGHCIRTLKNWIKGDTVSPIDIHFVPVYKYKSFSQNIIIKGDI